MAGLTNSFPNLKIMGSEDSEAMEDSAVGQPSAGMEFPLERPSLAATEDSIEGRSDSAEKIKKSTAPETTETATTGATTVPEATTSKAEEAQVVAPVPEVKAVAVTEEAKAVRVGEEPLAGVPQQVAAVSK